MINRLMLTVSLLGIILSFPVSHAATLVNDFSGSVTGFNWVDPNDTTRTDGISSNYTTNYTAATGSFTGLVNSGFVTVDYQSPFPPATTYSYNVKGYDGFSGPGLDLNGITGFEVSLRKEFSNTAAFINFYIIGTNDNVYEWTISTLALSLSEFRAIPITLSSNSFWINNAPTGAWEIGVSASGSNPPASARYNFSIDSIISVPEPSSSLLVVSGLGALAFLRRRSR